MQKRETRGRGRVSTAIHSAKGEKIKIGVKTYNPIYDPEPKPL